MLELSREFWAIAKAFPLWPDALAWALLLAMVPLALNTLLSMITFPAPRPLPDDSVGEVRLPDVPTPKPADPPLLSILIPARNEESRLPECLTSLCACPDPALEILVLDDNSTDATSSVVQTFAARDPRIKLLRGAPLPEGWVGKNWACHQLAQHARAPLLLFTDADTVHHPHGPTTARRLAEKLRADLLSLWPRQITRTWSEWLVIPNIYVLILTLRPQWMERLARWPILGAANGQFLLITRAAYDACGGHAALRSHLVEDVAFSRLARAKKLRALNADGQHLVACRMYENFAQVWEGFTKNLRAMFDDKSAAFVLFGLFVFGVLVMPFPLLAWCLLAGHPTAAIVSLAHCLLILAVRALLAARFLSPPQSVILHPLGLSLVLLIACNSALRTGRRGVTWKGRVYTG